MTGLEQLREAMAAHLEKNGVHALCAWPDAPRDGAGEAVCAVSIRKCEAAGAALCDYLGERYDEAKGTWQELYGKRLTVTFGLDLYAGVGAGGEEAVRTAFDALAGALQKGGPKGLRLNSLSCGETAFDAAEGRYRCPVEAECQALLYAEAESGAAFLDFMLKGEWKH